LTYAISHAHAPADKELDRQRDKDGHGDRALKEVKTITNIDQSQNVNIFLLNTLLQIPITKPVLWHFESFRLGGGKA